MNEAAPKSDDLSAPITCLIAFLDLLGFREVIGAANSEQQKTILTALREVADSERNFEVNVQPVSDSERSITIHPAITSFSDNILISYDLEQLQANGGVYLGLLAVRNMAAALAHRAREFDCLLRGGVTVGQLYHKDRVAFGTGLINAYELESTGAFFPRVILASNVVELIPAAVDNAGDYTIDRAMFRDADGYWCLDYMTGYLECLGSDATPEQCSIRRTWALGARARYLEMTATLAAAGRARGAQKWAWFAARFEKSMLAVSPYRFNADGRKLEFP